MGKQRKSVKVRLPDVIHVGDTVELKGVGQECLIEEIWADGSIVVRVDSWLARTDQIERINERATA